MKIVYENRITKHTKVIVGQIETFDPEYLKQYELELNYDVLIEKQAQSHFARVLLAQELAIDVNAIQKNGRVPYVEGLAQNFSLSHTDDKVAVIIGENRVGIDIEKEKDKILRIQHKFVREDEAEFVPEENKVTGASIIWGAKESLFKLYSKGAVSYLNDLKVEAFENFDQAHFDCKVMKEEEIYCKGFHHKIGDYRLVSVWEA